MTQSARPPGHDEQRMRAYLLGGLNDDERAEVEDRLIADEAYSDAMVEAEYDLVDDYVRGALTADERAAVERRLLTDAEGQRRLALARALGARGAKQLSAGAGGGSWPGIDPRLAAAAVLVIASLAAVGWLARENTRLRGELAAERAEPARVETAPTPPVPSPPPPADALVAELRLSSRVLRSDTSIPTVRLEPGARLVRVLLPLDETAASVTVAVERAGAGRIWTQADVTERDGNAAVIWLPASLLPPGAYEFLVWRGQEEPASLLATYNVRLQN